MARTYKRDSRGRFAGGGGGSSGGRGGRPKARMQERGRNRLTRDNAGKITGQGGSGATARGGRLKTAAGNQRGAVLMKAKGGAAGTVGKGGKVKGGTTANRRPSIGQRLDAFEAKLKKRAAAWKEEARKADNAFARNNDVSLTPRLKKIIDRRSRVDRQGKSLQKAAKSFRQIDLVQRPEKYGYARGSAQRKQLAAQIRQERSALAGLKAVSKGANRAYQAEPMVRFGLTSEIGGNRRQSRKAKANQSNRITQLVDSAVGSNIAVRKQQAKLGDLRRQARNQTRLTNATSRRRR